MEGERVTAGPISSEARLPESKISLSRGTESKSRILEIAHLLLQERGFHGLSHPIRAASRI
jgi:hypothetical protein